MDKLSEALKALQQHSFIILVDDEDRENEGDLVVCADGITAAHINFMAQHARGLICLSLTAKRIEELALPLMASNNRSRRQTAFTVSIEATEGVSTGISAADRAHTIAVAVDPKSTPRDLVSPGHVFPLKAQEGGVLVRAGHTEGALDLMRLAGLPDSAVICEIMNDDGTMARRPDLELFAKKHTQAGQPIPIISIKDLIEYRLSHEFLVKKVAQSKLPTTAGDFIVHAFESAVDGTEHLALVCGNLQGTPLVRVHSECLTGDALLSQRCDCGAQLQAAMKQIQAEGNGALIYMRKHEGRGIGLLNKIRAYELQDQGLDTVEANHHLGFKSDLRHYGIGAQIIKSLGIQRFRLLTNNPKKVIGLDAYGLQIIERIAIQVGENAHNQNYLDTKRDKMGHLLSLPKRVSRTPKI